LSLLLGGHHHLLLLLRVGFLIFWEGLAHLVHYLVVIILHQVFMAKSDGASVSIGHPDSFVDEMVALTRVEPLLDPLHVDLNIVEQIVGPLLFGLFSLDWLVDTQGDVVSLVVLKV
jgi:hypothetical protein